MDVDEKPVTGGDRVEVIVRGVDGPEVWALDGSVGYVQRRFVDASQPTVEVLFPPTPLRKQLTLKLSLDSVKRKKE